MCVPVLAAKLEPKHVFNQQNGDFLATQLRRAVEGLKVEFWGIGYNWLLVGVRLRH